MQILTNHIGYHTASAKRMILQCSEALAPNFPAPSAQLIDQDSGSVLRTLPVTSSGSVPGWKDRYFYLFDFSDFTRKGVFRFEVAAGNAQIHGLPFTIGDELLQDSCISDILFYFKGQRSSGRWDLADRSASFFGERSDRVDVHGGWYDAAGDYSKYLSHLSYANYLNPQQIPLVVWSLYSLGEILASRSRYRGTLLVERALEEGAWGADFLVRMLDSGGYFYMTLFDQWNKKSDARMICAFKTKQGERLEEYQAGFRQGGGMAIAALARAARFPRQEIPSDGFDCDAYRQAAEKGYEHLLRHNCDYLDNGRENIIDYYCALLASVELFTTTKDATYLEGARSWACKLSSLFSDEKKCWFAEAGNSRPFFHASDSGMPILSLLRYAEIEVNASLKAETLALVEQACRAELSLASEVHNPFGLARQKVKAVGGKERSSFFVPHENESGYWWQGENARLASLACAMRQAAAALAACGSSEGLLEQMQAFATAQLDWILGFNPFDTCMLAGRGRNNPRYESFYPNAPGGICNGITAGFFDESDIDFLPKAAIERGDHRWRWSEQWIPHGAWFLMALAAEMVDGGDQ
ncbi:glycoside hydrolase family 9 protein [Sediminispirochaeta smaragdinae]|uniref:Glycoside hydrolase family 9 n=1 Tax=Sediminispirochaeta smaragdinae (strain DSM 11293 / JCM 15392 / SEBR 4228) TaxID=573413 RepID=E1R2P8_SEDSS|nr:glycoside hydrolase family 9 protein [Sediminispirochaeta smaragdinae]ADK80330.1 glycoside hydrolase family 9 [Sediminispirochaeta smaragdinae DSM 11293]